jgi:ribosomal protein L17
MRHQKKRLLKIDTWVKTRAVYLRVLLTNLVKQWKLTTTQKRAKVVKAEIDSFFSKLLEITARFENPNDARRECIRYITSIIYGDEGKKVLDTFFQNIFKKVEKQVLLLLIILDLELEMQLQRYYLNYYNILYRLR